jgi:hypothetical protein
MHGAIYLKGLSFVQIAYNTFELNDPGPILNDRQIVGLIRSH